MELKSKLYLLDENGDKFMGMGVLWLLQAIDKTKSLREAASELNISYSKAYKMINNLETSLGKTVIDRKKGGAERQGVTLTPFGVAFYQLYFEFQSKAKQRLMEPYEEFCNKLKGLMED